MKRRFFIYKYIPLLGILILIMSCNHKELCFEHDLHVPHGKVKMVATYETEWQYDHADYIDWSNLSNFDNIFRIEYDSLRPKIPTGLRKHVKSNNQHSIFNIHSHGEELIVPQGEYSLLFYNNDTEYIVFNEIHSFDKAYATTRKLTRATYQMNPQMSSYSINTVNQPDILYTNSIDLFAMTEDNLDHDLTLTMQPVVFTYLVNFVFDHGLEYVSLARGALAGMAESVFLYSKNTSHEAVSVLFEGTKQDFGIQAQVRSFGVPDFSKDGDDLWKERQYGLNLEVRLKNGDVKSFNFDITNQIINQPQGGVIVVRGIEISDEEGLKGGSGFDIIIEDWGEYEDIELPL